MTGKRALYAGSFDPPTLGHLDLIQRASKLCDTLYIGIGKNYEKTSKFSVEEKDAMLCLITQEIPQVQVRVFSGLAVDFAKECGADFLIRGVRNLTDFEYETQMAFTNRIIGGIDTVFLIANENYANISSSLIKEIALLGRRLHDFIPSLIEETVFTRYSTPRPKN